MEQPKEYYAFISYKREDEKWAKWLQDKLEHYRFPTNLNGRTDLPKNIRPTFRDVTDLKPGLLAEEINSALRNSEWLIVVCSPRSAKSPWVCKEAQTFIDFGRADHIIPFVIEGNPFSNDTATECYPEALLNLTGSKELLAANINEMGRDAAAIKVVARMFNLRFDALWQRHEKEKKRKRWIIIGGTLLFAFVSLAIGSYIAWQNRELDAKNKEVVAERDRANSERDRANFERDRAEAASDSLKTANDSIERQFALIEHQKDEIATERDNVVKANWKMMENQSRAVAEKATSLLNDGDSYIARQLALAVLPNNLADKNRPYVSEAEVVLRQASLQNSAIFRGMGSSSVTLSPDGDQIVSAFGNSINIIDARNGTLLRTLNGHQKRITSVAYSPDGKRIASGSEDYTIKIWDAQKGSVIYTLKNEFKHAMDSTATFVEEVDKVVFSNDGKYLLSTSHMFDHSIKVWDVKNGTLYNTLNTDASVRDVVYSSDGKEIISVLWQGKIDTWDAQTWKRIKSNRIVDVLECAAISPDGRLLALGSYGIKVFDMQSDSVIMTLNGHTKPIEALSFSADGKSLLSASDDHTIRLWNLKTKKQTRIWEGHRWEVNSICFLPDGERFVSTSNDGDVRIWDISMAHSSYTFDKHSDAIAGVAYNFDGSIIASASWDKSILVWDAKTKQILHRLLGHTKDVLNVEFSPNGKQLVSCSRDHTIRIWDINKGSLIKNIDCYGYDTPIATFSHDGHYMVSTSGESIVFWDTDIWQIVHQTKQFGTYYNSVSCNPKGRYVVSASYTYSANLIDKYTISIWDLETGEKVKSIETKASIQDVKYSPDGKMIASTMGRNFALWNAATGDLIHTFEGHRDDVTSICFSPNGQWIVSASQDKQIKVWNVPTRTLLTTFDEHGSFVESVAFNPNGKEFVSASLDHTVKIWAFPVLQELIDETSKRFINRKLTSEERKQYYLE